jgi:hypothetical protein
MATKKGSIYEIPKIHVSSNILIDITKPPSDFKGTITDYSTGKTLLATRKLKFTTMGEAYRQLFIYAQKEFRKKGFDLIKTEWGSEYLVPIQKR